MVDYNYALVMLPFNIVGSMVGVVVYVTFPELIITCTLTAVLIYLFIVTMLKLHRVFH